MNWKSRRKTRRHSIDSSRQIEVQVGRVAEAVKAVEPRSASVLDISPNGFKLCSHTAYEFQEKIVVSFPGLEEDTLESRAEVRWVEPNRHDHSWSVGCLLDDPFPADYIDEMARRGILNRRSSKRVPTEQEATGRWELTQEDVPVKIVDVSAHGMRILINEEPEVGKRIRIRVDENRSFTARAVWTEQSDTGYFVGCEVSEGSPLSIIEKTLSHALADIKPVRHRKTDRYQVLSFVSLSLILVLLIRDWFF